MKLILLLFVAHVAVCIGAFFLSSHWEESSRVPMVGSEQPIVTDGSGDKHDTSQVQERVEYVRAVPSPLTLYAIGGVLALLLALGFQLWQRRPA